jgi:hypothetical protein
MFDRPETPKIKDFEDHNALLRECSRRFGFGSGHQKLCNAIAKSTGRQCGKAAMVNSDRCATHGGRRNSKVHLNTVRTRIQKEVRARIKMDRQIADELEAKLNGSPVSPETQTYVKTHHTDYEALWKPWKRILMAGTELYRRGEMSLTELKGYTNHLNLAFRDELTHRGKMAGTNVILGPKIPTGVGIKRADIMGHKPTKAEGISAEDLADF